MPDAPVSSPGPSVAIVTLGCARNEVDSDQLAGLLHRSDMTVVDDAETADVVLVNTCTFIAPAKQESIDTVLAACDLKHPDAPTPARAVLVVGCMAQRYAQELADAIPEADAVVGFDGYARLPDTIRDALAGRLHDRVNRGPPRTAAPGPAPPRSLPLLVTPTREAPAPPEVAPTPRRLTTSQDALDRMPASGPRFPVRHFGTAPDHTPPWAYLKIASGCDRRCTFCAIPSFRGPFRSRPLGEIHAEAAWLAARGAHELVLVSENTTSWGKDLPGGRDQQPELLRALCDVDGVDRIRLMYLQPAELTGPLLEAMAGLPGVASYFDLSLQHVAEPVVSRMARSGSPERFLFLVERIRDLDPHAVFRSNFILGFPGETERDVSELEDFLEAACLDWVGLFTYSPEDGTPAAELPEQVPEPLARERLARIDACQERIADEAARRYVGRRLDVTVQGTVVADEGGVELCVARSYREAPDTDGEIQLVTADGAPVDLPAGRTLPVEVVDAVGVDLVAIPLPAPTAPGARPDVGVARA